MDKKIAIMQPYIFPYIGYFQLINSVDEFIIYDNIQYTKKGWINRNRILVNEKDQLITLPLKKASDYLNVNDRELSESWENDKKKILNTIKTCYSKAPYSSESYKLIQECLDNNEINLFKFIFNSLNKINEFLDIKTKIIISSSFGEDKLIALHILDSAYFFCSFLIIFILLSSEYSFNILRLSSVERSSI